MRYILVSILIIFFANTHILNANNELIPLSKKIKEFNLKTEIGKLHYLAYFSLRCGSLFSSINDVIPNKNYLNAALNLHKGALITAIMIKKTNQRQIKKDTDEEIDSFKNIYSKIIQINYDKNNTFIKGSELLSIDEETCKNFVPRAYRFLKNNRFTIRK